jgi:hypothetical protein
MEEVLSLFVIDQGFIAISHFKKLLSVIAQDPGRDES